jgi:RIO-like serine/threonine protein kinase
MGFLLGKMEGRPASIQDLDICEVALGKLHELGYSHGDVNRYNFVVAEKGVKTVDFECLQENASPDSMYEELGSLCVRLTDESGLGGGFIVGCRC